MKYLITTSFTLLFCISIYARTIVFFLNPIDETELTIKTERSLSMLPVATLDGNVISISTEKTLENTCIYVVDAHGQVWYEAEIGTLMGTYSFVVTDHPNGTLTLVVQTAEGNYAGEFTLE